WARRSSSPTGSASPSWSSAGWPASEPPVCVPTPHPLPLPQGEREEEADGPRRSPPHQPVAFLLDGASPLADDRVSTRFSRAGGRHGTVAVANASDSSCPRFSPICLIIFSSDDPVTW